MIDTRNNPTVSVIMPTYNRGHIVGAAIQSILDQTYRDFEFIIVDDASRDNTEEVVKSFKDERIKYIRLDKNSGTSAVPRNTGIKIARGTYIAQQDDDTIWHPEKLEKQVKVFESAPSEVGVVYTGFSILTDKEKFYLPPLHLARREGDIYRQVLRQEGFSVNPPMLVRRECLEKVGGYDDKLPAFLDWDLWIRVSKHYHFRLIDEPLVSTYYSASTSYYGKMAFLKGYLAVLDKHAQEYIEADKELLAMRYFELGLALSLVKESAERATGRGYLRRAFRLYPLRLRYGLAVIAALLGLPALYNRVLSVWDMPFRILRPLVEGLRPFFGWAYPSLNKVWHMFLG